MIARFVAALIAISLGCDSAIAQHEIAKSNTATLADAVESSDWPTVRSMLQAGTDVNQQQADGMSALHWAVFHDHHKTIEELLTAKSDPNHETIYKISPLSLACEVSDVATIKLLLEAKADIGSNRLGGETPLMIAARRGNHVIVRELIKRAAQLDAKESGGQTALMWAAAGGHAKVVAELIQAGATLDIPSRQGFTAFMFAARQGHIDVVSRFVEAGVDPDAIMDLKKDGGRKPRIGTSALLLAVESGHYELAMELIKLGADPNDQRSGYAPLQAISWVRKTKRGDDPDGDPAPRGSGALTSLSFVRAIVAAGGKVNLQLEHAPSPGNAKLNHNGATPFMMAASTADLPLMKLLIELGADPSLNNVDGTTPLMAAAGVGVVAVGEEPGTEEEVNIAIEYLVGLGNDPNVVDKNRETAMHGAAYRNFPGAVAMLAKFGADPKIWNQKNSHNWTPHRIAEGYRPGSFKPSPATTAALDAAMVVEAN